LGPDGYRLGGFPPGWAEGNGRYRDSLRRFWRGEHGLIGEVASRITASSDLFDWGGRRPWASVNFITAHDGFTLTDLVAHEAKHNEANGESNRDGTDANWSWNSGAEGATDDPVISERRRKRRRNLMASLLLSQGVPMMLAGDEFGHSQGGNNNAYCQDNRISWLDWDAADLEMQDFTRRLLQLRRDHPVLRRDRFFTGAKSRKTGRKDIIWITPEGREMSRADWQVPYAQSLGVMLVGEELGDDDFLLLCNGSAGPLGYQLPNPGGPWEATLDTSHSIVRPDLFRPGESYYLGADSLVLLRYRRG